MRRTASIPKLRRHPKGSVVVLDGRYVYCGPYGSAEARQKYDRVVNEWLANGRRLRAPQAEAPGALVEELLLAYWRHVQSYYVKEGRPTSEQDTVRQALRFVRRLYGTTPVRDFDATALKAVRQAMIDHPVTRQMRVKDPGSGKVQDKTRVLRRGLARRYINKQVARIKRMFAWGVGEKLVPQAVFQELATVAGLERGRSAAREKPRLGPVSEADVEAVLPVLPPTVAAMAGVQRLCGGRPQDVLEMRPADIDTAGAVWEFRPRRYKTQHLERERVVYLGPRAQELLKPYLEGVRPDEYVFSPARSEAARLALIRTRRGLPASKPSRDRGKWKLRDRYDAGSYRRAVRRACQKVGVPVWCPLQLRHAAGTAIRRRFGLEATQAVLGHAELGVTQVYAEVDADTARRVVAEMG